MTNDRIVAALKPAVLDELPQGDMDARIAAIVSSPRPARATRTRRASLRPLPLAMTGIMAVLAAGGAVVVAAGVIGSAHRSAHRVTSVPPAPPRVQAAALSFTRHGGYLTVQVKDPVADPARYKKEFAARGLNVDLTLRPVARRKAGTVVFLEDDGDGKVQTILARGRCGTVTCGVGVRIPLKYRAYVRVIFGRTARPGEFYDTGPGDTPGEGVGLSDVRGRTVADVLAEARRKHLSHIEYRYQPVGHERRGGEQPYPMGVPADKVKGDWRVYTALAGSHGEVIMFVHPAG